MADKIAACQKPLPYGGFSQQGRQDRTASPSPVPSVGHDSDLLPQAPQYLGSYGETSDSGSSCSEKVFSKSHRDCLPCSCKQFLWDHMRELGC